ncbi:serine/threonine-protein kinase Rio2 [Chloropicon primus]|uniref:Serine/threonine-protein kinase RIO2 n=1 Tax=Chloropicon primus TaxID=1764295 RepID=A0A5B8MED6_9CHLO|nr:serine/threonine-protein kinase Rio2 [Chloropicon primus]UPQ97996.1 serine/threonine-protein kinase Rio2 [Chloropicon primus]|eukprot:QDZ18789.1 serine/threonine-protein kinase Rio2 [Chloropicon primus]
MKLDANMLRYLSKEDFRVLTAVEMGQKNHEMVPTQLVSAISGLRHGGSYKVLRTLLRHKLIHHENKKYDGYRLTTLGYDYLALRALCARGVISGVGRQIGVGKESDVYEVVDEEGNLCVCKFHRLGRTSFRAVKTKRDYLKHRSNYSWLYLSRLAARKEFDFMRALGESGLPVPEAIDHNRHCVVMSIVEARPLSQVVRLSDPAKVYKQIMQNMVDLAKLGLVHCDFNEFNIMLSDEEDITVIDFPQMISVKHKNAAQLFQRDVDCVVKFFTRKVKYSPDEDVLGDLAYPDLDDIVEGMDLDDPSSLDRVLKASGFKSRMHEKDGSDGDGSSEGPSDAEDSEDDSLFGSDGEGPSPKEVLESFDGIKLREGADGDEPSSSGADEAGDLDGLLQFAKSHDEPEAAESEGWTARHSSRKPKAANGRSKPKTKTNANKDKSGRRHQGVKHKVRISKSDY